MKFLIAWIVFVALSSPAYACSPPLPLDRDAGRLQTVFQDEAFRRELMRHGEADLSVSIVRVELNATVDVVLSNGCTIKNRLIYLPPPPEFPGLCPRYNGLEIESVCN